MFYKNESGLCLKYLYQNSLRYNILSVKSCMNCTAILLVLVQFSSYLKFSTTLYCFHCYIEVHMAYSSIYLDCLRFNNNHRADLLLLPLTPYRKYIRCRFDRIIHHHGWHDIFIIILKVCSKCVCVYFSFQLVFLI